MAEIIPFKGVLYNTAKVAVEDVLAPPYDVISAEYREALYMQSPYNIVRIDFGKEEPGDGDAENKYTRARKYLEEWREQGAFITSDKPSFYAYEISYAVKGIRKRMLGFLGLVKLEELGKGSIYPHECTHSKPKQDRRDLMKACEAQTSPIFSLYKSPEKRSSAILSEIAKSSPYIEAADVAGDTHRLWQIDDPESIRIMQEELCGKAIFIADGHHRYETAYEYYRERTVTESKADAAPYSHVLMFLANTIDEGITILPTHRLLRGIPADMENLLSEYFRIEAVAGTFDIESRLAGRKRVFGFYQKGKDVWDLLVYKSGDLSGIHPEMAEIDVFVLHELVLRKVLHAAEIGYEMNVARALERVKSGEFDAAFFLNPTGVDDVERAALSSVRMPPKSTYFYPKLMTGLVIHKW